MVRKADLIRRALDKGLEAPEKRERARGTLARIVDASLGRLSVQRGARDHRLNYWDAQVWDGQTLEGVTFQNPFARTFDLTRFI